MELDSPYRVERGCWRSRVAGQPDLPAGRRSGLGRSGRQVRAGGRRPGPPLLPVPPAHAWPGGVAGCVGRPAARIWQATAAVVTRPLTLAEIADLPAVTDLVTAGRALGLGRTKAYDLARAGQFPCPLIRAGRTWLVPTAGLLIVLGLPVPGTGSPDTGPP